MIRFLIGMLILAFVANRLYGFSDESTPSVPHTPTPNLVSVPTPIPMLTPKPTTIHLSSKIVGAPASLLSVPASPSAAEKIVTGAGTVLAGVGILIRDETVAMVDNGDETSRAICGLLAIIWTGLGLLGIAVLRLIGRLLGGFLG
jgi:hypothetical protein